MLCTLIAKQDTMGDGFGKLSQMVCLHLVRMWMWNDTESQERDVNRKE